MMIQRYLITQKINYFESNVLIFPAFDLPAVGVLAAQDVTSRLFADSNGQPLDPPAAEAVAPEAQAEAPEVEDMGEALAREVALAGLPDMDEVEDRDLDPPAAEAVAPEAQAEEPEVEDMGEALAREVALAGLPDMDEVEDGDLDPLAAGFLGIRRL